MRTEIKNIVSAAIATNTPVAIDIANAVKITIVATRATHTSGSSVVSVTVSADGVNYITYNRLITNAANTNSQTIIRAASLTLSSATSDFLTFSPEDSFKFMKVAMTRVTDGANTCNAIITYDDHID